MTNPSPDAPEPPALDLEAIAKMIDAAWLAELARRPRMEMPPFYMAEIAAEAASAAQAKRIADTRAEVLEQAAMDHTQDWHEGYRAGRRYLHGWFMFFRAIYLARTKKRGAGRQRWRYALETAHAYRWIVDGQMRGKPFKMLFRK